MNIKPILSTLILFCLFAISCDQFKLKMSPIDYNNELCSVTDSLYSMGLKWGKTYAAIKEGDKDYSKLKPTRVGIESFIIMKKKELLKLSPVGIDGEELRNVMIRFMDVEFIMIRKGFAPIENLTAASTEQEIQDAYDKLVEETDKEDPILKKVQETQASYAQKNGFKLESAKNL